MVSCMDEDLRIHKRTRFREAKSIFLGFDDTQSRKLLRFKCDVPDVPFDFDANKSLVARNPTWLLHGARIGVVGCMPMGLNYDLSDYERDCAERTCEEVVKLLRRLCTPAREPLDATFFDDVCKSVRGLVLDGALLKTARYLKAYRFANIVIIVRDPAHIIRTSCRDPSHGADVFSEQYERLFGEDNAVLEDFMKSAMRQRQLEEALQELAKRGDSTPSLTSVLKRMDLSSRGSKVS